MSLLAGYDLVAELSNDTVRKLLMNNLLLGGEPMVPPFEISIPLAGNGVNGSAHLVIKDLLLDLKEGNMVTLTLAFDRGSVVVTAPVALTICPLAGSLTVTMVIRLTQANYNTKQVMVDLAHAVVAINWSAATNQEIIHDLNGTPITPALFNTLTHDFLTDFIHGMPAPNIPLGFQVDPNHDGSLVPALRFAKLDMHCLANANRHKQALVFYGILLKNKMGSGNVLDKTKTAITAASDGACISISPDAFHSLVFCPAVMTRLGTDAAHMPLTCGSSPGFDTQGVTINQLADSFANGHIAINGSVSKSVFCYEATGTFHGSLVLSLVGATIQPNLTMDQPNIDVSVDWYCWLVAGVILGPIGIAIAAAVGPIAEGIANSLAGDAIQNAFGSTLPGINVGGLPQIHFNAINTTTEGINLQGTVPLFTASATDSPHLSLSGSVTTTHANALSSGIFHTQIWCLPTAKDYPYTEYALEQKGTYHLSGTLVTQPLTPHFAIDSNGTTFPLVGNNGTIAIPQMLTHYPFPLATGGTSLQQTVHVTYLISGQTLQLTNVPDEGVYGFDLVVSATDCNGNAVTGSTLHPLAASVHVHFEGHHVNIGGGYQADVQYCAGQLKKWMDRIMHDHGYAGYHKVPIWQQVNYPAPEDMVAFIRDLVALNTPEADAVLVSSKLAHGNSFYRGILSPAASQPSPLLKKTGAANRKIG
ncbi:MAG: hypothetical protein HQL63_08730 [Magnetococcales bacterium]|nr:hypothetical protein [Magnetococcales bacterium]MBF0322208.1 hypothetical protein [Magnetococcales bacterium]